MRLRSRPGTTGLLGLAAFLLVAGVHFSPAGASEWTDRAVAAPQAATLSELPLWTVTDGDRILYLLGSVHMLRPEVFPLDEALTEAFHDAEVVAFELDLDVLQAGAMAMLQRGTFQDERTLRGKLDEATYEELSNRFESFGVPTQLVENLKPWMASLMLSSLVIQQAGYEAESGIDLYFFQKARAEGKEIVALESLEEQIEIFDGLSIEAQAVFLESTLEGMDGAVEDMDRMSALWERGDADELAEVLTESLSGHPELAERILHERNRNWVPQIEELLEAPRTAIVIVGMGHMVGEGSVVELLRDRGYAVERWGGS